MEQFSEKKFNFVHFSYSNVEYSERKIKFIVHFFAINIIFSR